MSADERTRGETFLGRWSRVKTEAREQPVAAPPAPAPASTEPPPELPPVEKLTIDSDFSGFFHPKVDEDLRRSALRKLFSDPHFNVMDGLDVYIDDYSKSEPIPPAMLASLKQAQRILEWAAETEEEAQARRKAADAPAPADDEPEALPAPADEAAGEIHITPQNEAVPSTRT